MEENKSLRSKNQDLEKNFQYYFELAKKTVKETRITSDPSQDNFIKGGNVDM